MNMAKGTCRIEGCSGAVVGKRYCSRHYKLWRRGKLPKARYKICSEEGCRKARTVRAKCDEHVRRKAPAETAEAKAAAEPAVASEASEPN